MGATIEQARRTIWLAKINVDDGPELVLKKVVRAVNRIKTDLTSLAYAAKEIFKGFLILCKEEDAQERPLIDSADRLETTRQWTSQGQLACWRAGPDHPAQEGEPSSSGSGSGGRPSGQGWSGQRGTRWGGKQEYYGKPEKSSIVCYKCQKVGHYKSVCPEAKVKMSRIKSPGPEGKEGKINAEINGQECSMILDTGATMMAVPGRYITPSQYTGGEVVVTLADGSSTQLKEARVNVLVDWQTKPLSIIVLKDEAIEGLLGKDHPKTRSLLKGGKTIVVDPIPVEVRAVTRAQAKDQAQKRDEDRVAAARDGAQPNPPPPPPLSGRTIGRQSP